MKYFCNYLISRSNLAFCSGRQVSGKVVSLQGFQLMIQYKYALDSSDEIINISSLIDSDRSNKFICLSCGNQLIPRMGSIREWHFAHKVFQNCSIETYLHYLGKSIFKSIFQNCLTNSIPYLLIQKRKLICNKYGEKYGIYCDYGEEEVSFDLTKYFDVIIEEKKDNTFIPDILLKNSKSGNKIYVEIAVNHQATIEKINSGERIIEFQISTEEDLEIIKQKRIFQGEKLFLYNFKNDSLKNNYCRKNNCLTDLTCFILFKNSKSILIEESLSIIDKKNSNPNVVYYQILAHPFRSGFIYIDEVIKAYQNGENIKNCFLCRYHALNEYSVGDDDTIFCKFLKTKSNSNKAAECQYFRADEKVYSAYSAN